MKTIGILGGMSWESTAEYYKLLNEEVNSALGGLSSAKILLHSFDFREIEELQALGQWDRAGEILAEAAAGLESAGADFLAIATNTMHKVLPAIERRITIPVLHIADAAAEAVRSRGFQTVALLGTGYTMRQTFYTDRLKAHDLRVLIPSETQMDDIDRIIFDELCRGELREESRKIYLDIIDELSEKGAEGILLGCTEIGLLIRPRDTNVPLFDTTGLHVKCAVRAALEE